MNDDSTARKKNIWLWLFISIVALVIVINYINYRKRSESKSVDSNQHPAHKIPGFNIIDMNGEPLSDSRFRDKNVYIQFVNSDESIDIKLFEQVYDNFKNEPLEIVVFTNNPGQLSRKLGVEKDRVYISGDQFDYMRHTFEVAANIGSYFLYGKTGRKVTSGRNIKGYAEGPKIFLNELLHNSFFSIEEFIPQGSMVSQYPWLSQIGHIIKNEQQRMFVFFLSVNLCDQCGGGKIIDKLKALHEKYDVYTGFFVISLTSYSENDMEALSSQAGINFPIINSGPGLSGKWESFIDRFSKRTLDNIVFFADDSGKILSVMHSKCKCFKTFFEIVESTILERLEI